jgi:ribosomal protein S8
MSLVNLSHVCSHLQNASRARLSVTSIPVSNLHMSLAHQLQKSGFISTVTLGGLTPPATSSLLAHPPAPPLQYKEPTKIKAANKYLGIRPTEDASYHRTGAQSEEQPDKEPEVWELMSMPEDLKQPEYLSQVPTNPAQRRLWLGLKYWNNEPVLGNLKMISKPKRRIWMGAKDFASIARGDRRGYVPGLNQVGECMFVSTDKGVMEVRECLERGLGGMLLCRAW